jgi:hypothetical protein
VVKKMQKTKRSALLCLLLVASVGSAVVVQATGVMQRFGSIEKAEINIQSASVTLLLTAEDRQKVMDIVLMDPQIQELLEGADNYTIEVSEVFDINEVSFDVNEGVSGGVELVPREGVAEAIITINNDYGEEFGVQVITVTVDLENEEITETEVNPEIRKPKVIDDTLSPSELVQNPSEYDGAVVTVSGKVSLLGEVFGYLFMLDETVTVFYRHEEADVDVSSIENGDTVTVTGRFASPDTVYALKIDEVNPETDVPEVENDVLPPSETEQNASEYDDDAKDDEVNPEIPVPNFDEAVLSPSELVQEASNYDGVVVTVSGKVSLLGEVFGYLFMLDETVEVFYVHEEATVDVSNIENGDTVTVTGKFAAPHTIYATRIEKN